MSQPKWTLSLIIEWENAQLLEMEDRPRRMLQSLKAQLRCCRDLRRPVFAALEWPVEVMVVFDSDEIDRSSLEAFVQRTLEPEALGVHLRMVGEPDLTYYVAKNRGAELATGSRLLYLDSDVIPEAGWLESLIEAHFAPGVDLVGGVATIQPDSLYRRAMSAFWFFEVPVADGAVRRVPRIQANNFLCTRELLLRHPFPPVPGTSRGSCGRLWRELGAAGIAIHRTSSARLDHPPPSGPGHFAIRALGGGRDRAMPALCQQGRLKAWAGLLKTAVRGGLTMAGRIRARQSLLPNPVDRLAAWGLAGVYHTLTVAGWLLTLLFPRTMARRFHF